MNDNKKTNERVPMAILSCFLIAFILQGVLKLCGVLVFEKALDWDIFRIIDKYKSLQVVYYSIWSFITVYCLSLFMTGKPYSNKWWHYPIMIITAVVLISIRLFATISSQIDIVIDVCAYVFIPFIINITTDDDNKLLQNNTFGIVTTLALHIMFYFCYLGLEYWSTILNSIIPQGSLWLSASSTTLIHMEVYFGLIAMMLTTNELVKYIKRSNNMIKPVNIASTKAKLEAKKARIDKKLAKLQETSSKLAKEIEELKKTDAK